MVGLEIGSRSRALKALAASEERQAFLLKLSDVLRPLSDPLEVMSRVSEELGRHLGVGRCGYGEVGPTGEYLVVERDWTDGQMASLQGRRLLVGFGSEFTGTSRAGRTVVVHHALADARATGAEEGVESTSGVGASLGVLLIKGGRFVAGLFLQEVSPRTWSAEEEALAREVVERAWEAVERARSEGALARSEERYRTLFDSIDEGFCIAERLSGDRIDFRYVTANPAFERQTGLSNPVGHTMRELVPNIDEDTMDRYARVSKTGVSESFDAIGLGREFHVEALATSQPGQIAVLFRDITAAQRAEQTLRESEERQAFLLKLTDALRPLAEGAEIQRETTHLLGEHLGVDRCYYFETDFISAEYVIKRDFVRGNLRSLVGRHAIQQWPEMTAALSRGEVLVVDDYADSSHIPPEERRPTENLDIRAIILIPLVKQDILVACMAVIQAVPRKWQSAEISLVAEVAERTWAAVERGRAEEAVSESEERFAQFADASSGGLWIRDAVTLGMEYASRAVGTIYGVDPSTLIGDVEKWATLIVPEDRPVALDHLRRAKEGQEVVHEFRVQRPSDGSFRWVRNTDFPLHGGSNGHVQRIGGIAEDVTEIKLAAEHQEVLLAELQHRVRNIMAIIRSIVSRTARGAEDVRQYSELLSGRLLTLARVQALLTRSANAGVGIIAIVQDELAAQATHAEQFSASGPDIKLSAKAAETMTLAVHELTTNALKYGALSAPEGKVTVQWTVLEKSGVPWLSFDWVETGIHVRSEAPEPPRVGFGRELIEGRLPYELGGTGKVTIGEGGAQCHLEFPLRAGASVLETEAPKRVEVFGGTIDMAGAADLSGQRILIVEDDYYLANDTARALRGAGADVVGPCASEEAGREAASDASPT
ncbi:MAG: PAS domain S-box protein, partial [Terriglobus roseus]|nr:PAS domain S-box protein [Terriglobus roseus]